MTQPMRVVAVGGGHGTAVTLSAARTYAENVTAVVSVADDGGSSGRLRELLGVPALGDLRKCLVALAADDSVLAQVMSQRYREGELAGHALGNLLLAGLIESTGDLVRSVDEASRLLELKGRVLPATTGPVTLRSIVGERMAIGQVAVGQEGDNQIVSTLPSNPEIPTAVLEAIAAADQIVIGPGSLYTSVLAAAATPGIVTALTKSCAQRVFVCNLLPEQPESGGYSVADHQQALERHGIPIDVTICDTSAGMGQGNVIGQVQDCDLKGENGKVHDPQKLASVLQGLFVDNKREGAGRDGSSWN